MGEPAVFLALTDEQRALARLEWLHSPASNNVDGYEWGIYQVKWENGRAVQVCQTFSDFSDLDAAMVASGAVLAAQPAALTDERAALAELVYLKDLKDRLRKLHEMGHGTDYTDYHRRQPLAWERARAVLAAQPASVPVEEAKS